MRVATAAHRGDRQLAEWTSHSWPPTSPSNKAFPPIPPLRLDPLRLLETSIDLPRLISLASGLKRVAHLLRGVADAPVLPIGAFVEAQALLGLPLRALFDDQDFLWCRHNRGVIFEPDPFSAEFPFQHDSWPF